jgi:hypothetical protein
VTARTGRGELSIVDPTAFRGLYGVVSPNIAKSARIAALRLSVRNRETLLARLQIGAVPFITHMGHVVIEPANAMGATLVFEAPDG